MDGVIMKYFIGILLIVIIFLAFPRLSTKTEFDLTKVEYQQYKEKAVTGDFKAINKLYLYYHYSLDDCNKSIEVLKQGAKLGDGYSQYRLSLYFLRNYYPYGKKESFEGEGIYWLEQSAKQGYQEAIIELKKRKITSDI
jgi:TPR repeat protein